MSNSMKKKNIIVACDTFRTGGAETFALRMARFYSERGHTVYLFSYLGDAIDTRLVVQNAGTDIPILTPVTSELLNWLIYKIDGILNRMSIFYTVRRFLTIRFCRHVIQSKKIEVVHTNLLGSLDVWSHAAFNDSAVKIIHTIHGDLISYLYYSIKSSLGQLKKNERFYIAELMPLILKRVNYFSCPAEMHLKIFHAFGYVNMERVKKIYYPVDLSFPSSMVSREALSIPHNAFVFGSVARCTKKKGWGELIDAFLEAQIPNACLLLVGGGEYFDELHKRYGLHPNIILAGNQSAPLEYVKLFDVGISASYFWESLPTAIIEYLALGKPVICTDNAESEKIIHSDYGPAGVIVPLAKDQWGVIIDDEPLDKTYLKNSMIEIYSNKSLRDSLAGNALNAFSKFQKESILKQYEELMN